MQKIINLKSEEGKGNTKTAIQIGVLSDRSEADGAGTGVDGGGRRTATILQVHARAKRSTAMSRRAPPSFSVRSSLRRQFSGGERGSDKLVSLSLSLLFFILG